MNNQHYRQPEMEINLKEMIWGLLEQWKAVLIVALLMAVLASGAKYYKDSKAYEVQEESATVEQSKLSTEEVIEEKLSSLPDNERLTVEYLIKQNEWLDAEKEYVNKSILFKTDPTNQRTLLLNYFVESKDADDSSIASIMYAYSGFVKNEKVASAIRRVIAPEADMKYILELINSNDKGRYLVSESDDSAMLEIRIILPEDADAKAVENALTEELQTYSNELSKSVCPHSIKRIDSSDSFLYNSEAVNNRTNILYSIHNLTNNTKNMQTSLSDEQKAAVEQILQIKKEAHSENEAKEAENSGDDDIAQKPDAESTRPRLSKKYAFLGFILGAMAYAFSYLIIIILRGHINAASDLENYTNSRLLGEIYEERDRKGIELLLKSKLVEMFRHKGLTDKSEQISKTADTISAICKHSIIKEYATINLTNKDIAQLSESIKPEEAKITQYDISELNESELSDIKNALLVAGKETTIADLSRLASLCNEYGVNIMGNLFIGSL